jgi:hypothetical protein
MTSVFTALAACDPPGPGQRLAMLGLSVGLAGTWAQLRAEQDAQAWAARDAELAAHETTRRLLGDEAALWAVWDGQGDGTAVGVVDGLAMFYEPPERGGPEFLRLHRSCPACGSAWSTPVLGLAQLVDQLAADRCACPSGGVR